RGRAAAEGDRLAQGLHDPVREGPQDNGPLTTRRRKHKISGMMASAGRRKIADVAPPLVVGVLVIAGWEAACRVFAIPSYLFPSPSLIASTLVADAPTLLHALWVTLRVTLIALALATVIGATIAFVFVQSPIIERSFFPYAIILQVTPIVAIAPLIIILV